MDPTLATLLSQFGATVAGSFVGTILGMEGYRLLIRPHHVRAPAGEHDQASLMRFDLKDKATFDMLRKLDVDTFLKRFPPPPEMELTDEQRQEFALLNMHVVRANHRGFTVFEQHASRKWLDVLTATGHGPDLNPAVPPTPIKPETIN